MKKLNILTIRVMDKEKEKIERKAKLCDVTPSEYIRMLINKDKLKNKIDEEEIEEILATNKINITLMLTDAQLSKFNQLMLDTEQSKEDVITTFIDKGYVVKLPFLQRENEIRDLVQELKKLNVEVNEKNPELKSDMQLLTKKITELVKQDLSVQTKINTAVKRFIKGDVKNANK